ncbi:MAG TPA: HlyD family efflux transporter periplasmic adaptor subunit [Gammaproteobacteria bacterium]|nr:HlyD family efflux transporter periplasmic adaptor subunit [Gammaproteobacteria bacterium]
MNLRRVAWISLLALLVGAGLAWGLWPRAVPVDTTAVRRAPLEETVTAEGRTRVRDRYQVSSPVAGYLERVRLEVGDSVRRGAVLAELRPTPAPVLDARATAEAKARVAQAQAALEAARTRVESATAAAAYATAERKRLSRLQAAGHVSRESLERTETEARQRAAELRSARFEARVAHYRLEAAKTALRFAGDSTAADALLAIRAPVSGVVLRIARKSEGVIPGGAPILTLGDPRSLEIAVDVLSGDAVRIRPGMAVRLERWGGPKPLQARVRTVEPAGFTKVSALGVEEQRVWVIADIVSPPAQWRSLGDGYRVDASFVLWRGRDVLQVPASAVFRHRDGWAVFLVRDGRLRLQPVRVGRGSGLATQILSGLTPGETVASHPGNELRAGQRVRSRSGLPAAGEPAGDDSA